MYARSSGRDETASMNTRNARITRDTKETQILAVVDLDGSGVAEFTTGLPFLDHMLDQIARHGLIDITIKANGDLEIDAHHTVEDIGITFGQAVTRALGSKARHPALWSRLRTARRGPVPGRDRSVRPSRA